jgi:hypothetical protein
MTYSFTFDTDFDDLPSYEFRHSAAKLFEELDQHKVAAEIWENLLDEDDNIAEVHYCLAMAYSNFSTSSAIECIENARLCLKEVRINIRRDQMLSLPP